MAKMWADDPDPVTEAVQLIRADPPPAPLPPPAPGARHALSPGRPRRAGPILAGLTLVATAVLAAVVVTRDQPPPPPVSQAAQGGPARTSSWPVRPSDTSMRVDEDGPTTRARSCAPMSTERPQ
jgi:hypothetical protein